MRHGFSVYQDKQNVPRAVTLLRLTSDISNLDTKDLYPLERHIHRSLALLGRCVGGIIDAFILPDLSLSEQITRLLASLYLIFALFR